MEYGHPEGHTREKITVTGIVFYVEKRIQESIIYGGNVELLTNNPMSATSSLFKQGIRNKTNHN
eukprot:5174447-Heterocapsa_arctica.AAC.1